MRNLKDNVFLVIGASGVGKSTVCRHLSETYPYILSDEKRKYKHIDLDEYFARYKKMKVSEYFNKVGFKKFWEESYKYIKTHYKRHLARKKNNPNTILLIDVGAGSTLDYKSINLTKEFNTILLTADPEYLFEREKCKNNHKELGYFKWMEFSNERNNLYKNCNLKIDVSYLSVAQVSKVVDDKINNFNNGNYF
jgi:shikimate kinase